MDHPPPQKPETDHKQWPHELPEKDRVRRGVMGHNVRYVLILGLLGVIVAFFIAGMMQ